MVVSIICFLAAILIENKAYSATLTSIGAAALCTWTFRLLKPQLFFVGVVSSLGATLAITSESDLVQKIGIGVALGAIILLKLSYGVRDAASGIAARRENDAKIQDWIEKRRAEEPEKDDQTAHLE